MKVHHKQIRYSNYHNEPKQFITYVWPKQKYHAKQIYGTLGTTNPSPKGFVLTVIYNFFTDTKLHDCVGSVSITYCKQHKFLKAVTKMIEPQSWTWGKPAIYILKTIY